MKKYFYNFLSACLKISVTFAITLSTAIIASNNKNFVYNFLSQMGYTDPTIQRVTLSALITAVVSLAQQLLILINKVFLWVVKRYFKRLTVDINFKVNNRNKESIVFKPKGGEYEPVQVEIELEITPAGRIYVTILKFLGLQIEIFFNPQIIDVALIDDKEWLNERARTRINDNEAICIGILEDFRLGGFSMKPFIMTESIIIIPKRVKKDTAYIDFKLNSVIGNSLSRALCKSNMKELHIEIEGGK
ncbi:hypothetical protein HW35_13780 [Bacillus sp. X1(2014)]|jgi:hypothetical protein|nr:hypothetical protein HW35_13780 [Bacillus sp. X1(2014)]